MLTRREFSRRLSASMLVAAGFPASAAWPAVRSAKFTEDDAGAAALSAQTLRLLLAATQGLLGRRQLQGHYEAYYRFSARHWAEYAVLYRDFAAGLEALAARSNAAGFVDCDLPLRLQVLETMRAMPGEAARYENGFFQETLWVYQKTDAWLDLGYKAWEGSPRGVDSYGAAP
ncbi:MAG TPA: hypothetical protein VNU71_01145 [Burkholderiaceae bacterium]|nr:hypothetical protein [Burkholderiaceae bacterium]